MLLNLQNGIVYGPVHSRRLGCSLGINVLPANQKVCSFNCLYCQYGWTDYSMLESVVYPAPEDIFKAIELTLTRLPGSPDYITLSGNGEPTCHPNFVSIVDGILRLRDRFSPTSQVAILSNSSTVSTLIIRESLEKLDVRIMKLDVGALKPFQTYNIPAPDVSLEAITEGLSLLRDVTVQALFTGGILGNFKENNLSCWIERIQMIKPKSVQIYTLDRDCPSDKIEKLNTDDLYTIQSRLKEKQIHCNVY